MKKLVSIAAVLSLMCFASFAQDKQMFNHFAAGVTVGIDGFGFEMATTMSPYVQVRGGYSIFPYTYKRTESFSLALKGKGSERNYEIPIGITIFKGGSGKLLFDIFPGKNTDFHFTLGAYTGFGKLGYAYGDCTNYLDEYEYANLEVDFNGISVTTDQKGYAIIDAKAKTGSFIPYAGLGFGRTVRPGSRVRVSFDLGALITGGLKFQTYNFHDSPKGRAIPITSASLADDNGNLADDGLIDKFSKFPVIPMLKLNIFINIL